MLTIYLFSLAIGCRAQAGPPPLVVSSSIQIQNVQFSFPHDHHSEGRAQKNLFTKPLQAAMAEKVGGEILTDYLGAIVTITIWSAPDFHIERFKSGCGRRTHYRISAMVPPDATPQEIDQFSKQMVEIIPDKAWFEKYRHNLRPFRPFPTMLQKCTDWMIYGPHVDLF